MSVNSDTRGGEIGVLGDWGVGLILQHKIHEVVFFC